MILASQALERQAWAAAALRDVLRQDPASAKAHYRAATLAERLDALAAARWHASRSLTLAPSVSNRRRVEELRAKEEARRHALLQAMLSDEGDDHDPDSALDRF